MGDFLKSECPHCGQSIEYPAEGTGETVPCPNCEEHFVLTPLKRPAPQVSMPTQASPAPSPTPSPSQVAPPAPLPEPPPPGVQQRPATLQPPKTSPSASAAPQPRPAHAPTAIPTPPPKPQPIKPPQTLPQSLAPVKAASQPPAPLDQAYADFEKDQTFANHAPTREQVARAWAYARFKKDDAHEPPPHADIVGALKKLFPEFRSSKPTPHPIPRINK